jgi:hypothetical protein
MNIHGFVSGFGLPSSELVRAIAQKWDNRALLA